MSNISVTTTQNVIEVSETGGITVTTPEGQTINVEVPNSSVNVTNTTDDITITEVGITNTDQLIEGTTNLFFTNARARAAVSLTTDDATVLDYNSTTGVFTWDTPTTTKIAEGTNQYFTQARARQSLSAGTGISYDNSTGVITNTSINTDTTYTIDAATATGGANLTLTGSDSSTDSVKFASGTNITVSRTDANTITIDGTDTNTTYTQNASSTTGGANLNLVGSDSSTDTIKFASGTNITVSRTDANTITIDGSDLNTTYTIASSSTTGGANLTLTGSDSSTASVAYLGAGATTVTSTDANTVTITSTDTNTTYTQNASSTSGGANLNLVGSDSTTDSIKLASGTNVTVTRTDADTVTISSTDTNTTYTVDATATTGGANLNLTGSDSSTDSVAYLGSGATTITRTDANTITVSSTDTNTTYTQNISSTTGGANLNLVGSDSTTDTVKFANGTGVTVAYTDADTATISIGQDVATSANPTFAGATLGNVTVGVDTDQTVSTSSGNLILQTATGTNAGTMTLTAGANGDITLAPNGTGNVAFTFNNGGNLTNTRNYVAGAIRNATTDSIGDIWAVNSTGPIQPFRGVSVDNSADTTKNSGYVARNYSNTAGNRSRFIFERARGTAASPTAVQSGDFLGELDVTGYTSTGWLNDNVATVVPGFFGFTAAENWISNTNLGTNFALQLAPTATTITGPSNLVPTIISNPQALILRGDSFSISRGKATAFTATGCSTSGTELTIGTLTSGTVAVGQTVQSTTTSIIGSTYIVANISGSGSGSKWTLSSSQTTQTGLLIAGNTGFIGSPSAATTVDALADLRLITNNIKGSGGTTQIITSSAGATLELRGDNIQLENAAGTSIVGGKIDYRRTFGCFHKVANVTAAAADTVYNFDWYADTSVHVGNQGVTVTSGQPTRVNIDAAGSYTAFLEFQVKNTVSANRIAWIWLAKNGNDLTETRIKVEIKQGGGTDAYQLISKLWLLDGIAANDYVEVRFAVNNASGISLEYEAAQTSPFVMPAQPSATLTIVPVGA